nr:unnamed protein product [Callosobruchus chinensis]
MNRHTCTDLHDDVRNRRKKSSSGIFFGRTVNTTRGSTSVGHLRPSISIWQ